MCQLTGEHLKKLREPFQPDKISFKIQTTHEDSGLIVPYIDARDVMDRLDDVAGGEWWDEYVKAPSGGLECALTVLGVTRRDVGDDENKTEPEKSGYSDAFKRAAVKFGVGRFLYDLPRMYAKIEKKGNSTYLAKGEEDRLRLAVARALKVEPSKPEPQPARAPVDVGVTGSGIGRDAEGHATQAKSNGNGDKPKHIRAVVQTPKWQDLLKRAVEREYVPDAENVSALRLLNVVGSAGIESVNGLNLEDCWKVIEAHYEVKKEKAA